MPLSSFFASQKKNILCVCLLAILTFLSFSPALKAQFLSWDDNAHLTENVNVLALDLEHLKALFKQRVKGIYIPLSSFSFAIEDHFFGLNPFVFHLDNLILHAATAAVAFLLLGTLGLTTPEAFLAALIFAVHPTKAESVAWVAQRKDVLCGLFFMASLLSYQKGKGLLSFILGSLSMLANPLAVSLPLIMVLLDWFNGKGLSFNNILNKWLFFLVVFVVGWRTYSVHVQAPVTDLVQAPLIWLWSLSFYIGKFLTPTVTLPIYALPKLGPLSWSFVGPLLFLAAAAFAFWRLRKAKLVVFGSAFFLLSIFFLLRFDPKQDVHIAADHLLYIPSLGLCILAALSVRRSYQFLKTQEEFLRHLFSAAIGVLVVGLMLLTFNQSARWHDTSSLWKHQIKTAPHPLAYINLAADLKESQKEHVEEIMGLYRKAIELDSRYTDAYNSMADLYRGLGKLDDSLAWYNKALAIDDKNKDALYGLGLLYQKMNKPQQSISTFKRLLKLYPDDERVYINVTDAYSKAIVYYPQEKAYQEQREEVLSGYEELSKRKKYSAVDYFNLGFLYEQVGGYDEAIHFYKKSLEIRPTYAKALYNLANRYQEMGDSKTALFLYQRLVHYHPKYSLGYLNMGVIYNSLGDVKRAHVLYQKAIDVDPNNAGGYFNLGFLSESAGDLKEALGFYEKAVEIDPQLAEGYYNLGNVYAALGQNAEAMASYLKTVGINKGHQNAFVNLSILSFKAADFAGAIHYLEEAEKLGYTPPGEYLRSLEPYRKKRN